MLSLKKLIQSVPTRWNSTFYMLSRFVELKDAIKVTTALTSNTLPVLSEEEWEICKDLCTVLKPFEEITKQLSGEKYITGSDAIPLTRVLSSVCKSMLRQKICAPVKSVLEMLNQEIATRYHNIEHSGTLALCTFLDPRYRKPGFVDTTAAEAAKKHALELATKVFRQEKQPETQPSAPQEATSNCDSSVWEEFDRMIANTQPQGTGTSGAIVQVQRFLQEAYYPRTADPLLRWQKHSHTYPLLSKVVRERFGMVASSVPCERIFSKAGAFVNEKRTRLSSQHVRQLLFLNANYSQWTAS
ncbi:zinc finger BED domain-containing protein 4-like [Anabrus simplex]|uniref:zinc finger BED domain-containing protein 4-like n=1 Tax=Anabrus simplex TaxID=316456 RepID=UPI0035A3BEDA